MLKERHITHIIALLVMGSAILLSSCSGNSNTEQESLDRIKTEESHNLTIVMSENGRRSYRFETPLLEGYMLGRDPYREFCKGISITTYQDDSLSTVNAVLVANYAIYYDKRKLWEAKGDVVVTKHDGTRLYTQQLFWNSATKRIYSNVDTRLVTDTDELIGEGFESDEEMNEPRFRRWKGKMQVDADELRNNESEGEGAKSDSKQVSPTTKEEKQKPVAKQKPDSRNITPATIPSGGNKGNKPAPQKSKFAPGTLPNQEFVRPVQPQKQSSARQRSKGVK